MLRAARWWKPEIIVILGDFIDFYQVSSHDKHPKRMVGLNYEIETTLSLLTDLDGLKPTRKVYIAGNHEDRLTRYLMTKAPELYDVVDLMKILELDKRNWDYVAYKDHYQLGKLYITHDTGTAGVRAHLDAQKSFQDNVVIGHTHRLSYTVVGNAKGKPHVAAMFGWLGHVHAVDYMHKIKAYTDWATGFGIGYMERNGNVHVRPVPIVDNKLVLEGKLFEV